MGRFNLSHDHTLTCDMGELIPIAALEVLPGDVFRHGTSILLRTEALAAPLMHPVYMRVHHFFVPNRLVDDDWEDFITTRDGRDAVAPTITLASGSVADHMGLQVVNGDEIIAHPIRAYNLIYNEWFRDQDLNNPVDINQQTVLRCSWGRDYFTKARPQAQQGTAVSVPVDVAGNIMVDNLRVADPGTENTRTFDSSGAVSASGNPNSSALHVVRASGAIGSNLSAVPSVNLTGQGGIDINELRRALFLQQQAEQRQRYGSRYVDLLRQFGVRPQDSRLQRPELLGGANRPISFTEVVATAEGTAVDVGDLYGHGMGVLTHRPYRRMFPEHGWVISLLSVLPRTQYLNSVPKQFLRENPPDFWFPESEIEGPQPIAQREVYAQSGNPTDTWGWTGRHDEYRQVISYVSGEMRTTLNDWHMARSFDSYPALNGTFVQADPTNRIYQNTENDPLRVFVSHQIAARRPVSQVPMV